jgi:hypothetical protein
LLQCDDGHEWKLSAMWLSDFMIHDVKLRMMLKMKFYSLQYLHVIISKQLSQGTQEFTVLRIFRLEVEFSPDSLLRTLGQIRLWQVPES